MSTFLKLLPLELDGIDNDHIIEPDYPITKDDKVIGTMSESIKKLFTLGRLLEKDAKQTALDMEFCTDRTKKREMVAKVAELAAKSTVIKHLVWIGIRDETGEWLETVGVRSGFKVVIASEQPDDMPPFMKRIIFGE